MKPKPRAAISLAAVSLILAACDFPTAPPLWTTEWAVPAGTFTLDADSLLPDGVSVAADGSAFLVRLDGIDFTRSLAEMCGVACAAVPGVPFPKPAFSDSTAHVMPLPANVISVQLAGGAVDYAMFNGMSFDPIRPAGATSNGRVRLRLLSGAAVLGQAGADGATATWAPGTALAGPFAFATATVSGNVTADFVIDSPAGDAITVDADDHIAVTVEPGDVLVSSVTIALDPEPVAVTDTLDFELDSDFRQRVHGGSIIVRIRNTFNAGGSFDIRFTGAHLGAPIQRSLTIATGQSTHSIEFTGLELRQMLSAPTAVEVTGQITAPGGQLTVTPGQELEIELEMRLVIGYRDDDDGIMAMARWEVVR